MTFIRSTFSSSLTDGSEQLGIALAIVLAPVLFLAALAIILASSSRDTNEITRNEIALAKEDLAREAGINLLLLDILAAPDSPNSIEFARPRTRIIDGYQVETWVEYEVGRINVNAVDRDPLLRLIRLACLPSETIDRARQAHRELVVTTEESIGLNVSRFTTLSEFRAAVGLDLESFSTISPYLTVFGYQDRPEIGVAKLPIVMATLNIPMADAEALRAPASSQSNQVPIGMLRLVSRVLAPSGLGVRMEQVVYLTRNSAHPFRRLSSDRFVDDPDASFPSSCQSQASRAQQ